MAQQINLCNPIFLIQKRYFSASTMARSLGVFILVGGLLSVYWAWSLNALSGGYQQSVANNQREITRLQAAIQANRANAAPADAAQLQELQARQTELQQRELLLRELRRGLLREGYGHAARLQLVARSIPPQAWVTEIRADDLRLELSGFTQEPAALNGWVARLADSALLEGQQLAVVKVERVSAETRNSAQVSAQMHSTAAPLWSYTLVTAFSQAGAGGKP
jgi:Tfp pilus assembly protein PilN